MNNNIENKDKRNQDQKKLIFTAYKGKANCGKISEMEIWCDGVLIASSMEDETEAE